jgi:hypothetical protein
MFVDRLRFRSTFGALPYVDRFGLRIFMSYVDGSDEDGGDYPSKSDIYDNYTSFDYDTSSKSILISVVASYSPRNYSQSDEPSCSEQEIRFKAPIAAAFADDPNKPSSPFDAGKQDLDRLTQKMQDDIKADPDRYSLQCFGPPSTQPRDYLDRPPDFPFEKPEPEEERPEPPEEFYKSPFFESTDPRIRLIIELGEGAKDI